LVECHHSFHREVPRLFNSKIRVGSSKLKDFFYKILGGIYVNCTSNANTAYDKTINGVI